MTALRRIYLPLVVVVALLSRALAEDNYNQNQYNNNQYNDDAYQAADDGMEAYDNYNYQNDYQQGDDYIQYWTDYALLPKRCIVYNDVDVIVFSVHDHQYQQCSDEPIGTYIAPVPVFLEGYLEEYAQAMADKGNDDYVAPDEAQYTACTPFESKNTYYYFQIGCADGTSQELAVNIYSDNTCTTRSEVDGIDDANIDVSELQIPFKKCQACVNWVNKDEDEIDDQFYENRQTEAPLCKTAWMNKETCGRKCQHTGLEQEREGWSTPDKVLLAVLSIFGCIMLGLIIRKRQKMSNKDALLEQAAMSAAGLQQPHVIGIFVLVVLVIAVFALLGLKNITWALLLIINSALFAYLMKLTLDSSVRAGDTLIGPDGTIMRRDSDDSSLDSSTRQSSAQAGTYMLPTIT